MNSSIDSFERTPRPNRPHDGGTRFNKCLTQKYNKLFLQEILNLSTVDTLPKGQTSRDTSTAARTKSANRGCGAKGFDFSSGWNWTPMNQG